jgi:putative ABC transport system permease protein
MSALFRMFAGIAIFISCLGLYGLVSFMAVQRTKEIGVRKVLGASVADMMVLLSKEFTVLIGVAFLVAGPVAFLLTHRWLEGFAYRIRPGVGIFLSAAALSIVIAWVTVGYRTYRAAVANPAGVLRNE